MVQRNGVQSTMSGSLDHRVLKGHTRTPTGTSLDILLNEQQRLMGTMRSASTQRSLSDIASKLVQFNQRHYPTHPASVHKLPRFASAV
jgi:hypothetical protein